MASLDDDDGDWEPSDNRVMGHGCSRGRRQKQSKKGADAVNDVQVVLNNDKALLYINGSQVSEVRGQEPRVGDAMGLFAQSESEQPTDWRFLNFAIVENQ